MLSILSVVTNVKIPMPDPMMVSACVLMDQIFLNQDPVVSIPYLSSISIVQLACQPVLNAPETTPTFAPPAMMDIIWTVSSATSAQKAAYLAPLLRSAPLIPALTTLLDRNAFLIATSPAPLARQLIQMDVQAVWKDMNPWTSPVPWVQAALTPTVCFVLIWVMLVRDVLQDLKSSEESAGKRGIFVWGQQGTEFISGEAPWVQTKTLRNPRPEILIIIRINTFKLLPPKIIFLPWQSGNYEWCYCPSEGKS